MMSDKEKPDERSESVEEIPPRPAPPQDIDIKGGVDRSGLTAEDKSPTKK